MPLYWRVHSLAASCMAFELIPGRTLLATHCPAGMPIWSLKAIWTLPARWTRLTNGLRLILSLIRLADLDTIVTQSFLLSPYIIVVS